MKLKNSERILLCICCLIVAVFSIELLNYSSWAKTLAGMAIVLLCATVTANQIYSLIKNKIKN